MTQDICQFRTVQIEFPCWRWDKMLLERGLKTSAGLVRLQSRTKNMTPPMESRSGNWWTVIIVRQNTCTKPIAPTSGEAELHSFQCATRPSVPLFVNLLPQKNLGVFAFLNQSSSLSLSPAWQEDLQQLYCAEVSLSEQYGGHLRLHARHLLARVWNNGVQMGKGIKGGLSSPCQGHQCSQELLKHTWTRSPPLCFMCLAEVSG